MRALPRCRSRRCRRGAWRARGFFQAEAAFVDGLGIEAYALVGNLDSHLVAELHQFHADILALAVLAGIGEPFLGDAIDGVFQNRGQSAKLTLLRNSISGPWLARKS